MSEAPILETRVVAKRFVTARPLFGQPTIVHAVDGVSLAIRRGETFAIVGESGCGKSTFARLLVRLLKPTEGTILFDGRDITHLRGAEERRLREALQFVFQDPFSSLNPRMTVGALVGEPMRVHAQGSAAERRDRVAELLRRCGLRAEFADRYPHEFSGGQRQRIGIARALASGPRVLVGDEPVSALDLSIQAQIINLLQDLKDDFALTLVVIAHDLAVVRHMSDRIAVMYLGELVELAPTEAFYDGPRHPYAQALLAAVPSADPSAPRAAVRLGGDVPSPTAPPPGCRFHTRCPHARERCRSERPVLRDSGPGRQAACHFFEEIEPVRRQSEGLRSAPNLVKRLMLYDRFRAREDAAPSI